MAFNTGLSGLRAASVDLDVTGNNIANASTVGFKGSKVQFGDLYANGFLSGGTNPIGDGVRVQDVKQSFGQGNISFTDSGLDMAISGDGFFILSNNGETRYSRAGQFGIDKDGFVVNNQNMKVQGYVADDDGNLSGVRGDLAIETGNLAPRRTTNLVTDLNLDSRQSVLEQQVSVMGEFGATSYTSEYNLDSTQGPVTAFPAGTFTVDYDDGTPSQTVDVSSGASAKDVAEKISELGGISASADTKINLAAIDEAFVQNSDFSLKIQLNGDTSFTFEDVASRDELIGEINGNTALNSLLARVNADDELEIYDNSGNTLTFEYSGGGTTNGPETTLGTVRPRADRNVANVTTAANGVYADTWANRNVETTNSFNPIDQRTYNHATSTTIYDSLGNSHEMTQFFVKEPSSGNGVGESQWSIYLQVDGEFVGGTGNSPYTATFNQDGQLESISAGNGAGRVGNTGEIIVTDWVPKDPNGEPNGAAGVPLNPDDVVSPIPEPLQSSAFVIDLSSATQYGASFGVNDQQQNGYTTGRLSGLDVSGEGVIFARYTNGQSKALGQVALAAFNNTNGLSPVGDTTWVESFESGQPVIGAPDTGTLGSIKASSVEESNVDLSAELVNLIIAQRNYQANAKTIETSDAVTQTVINLR